MSDIRASVLVRFRCLVYTAVIGVFVSFPEILAFTSFKRNETYLRESTLCVCALVPNPWNESNHFDFYTFQTRLLQPVERHLQELQV